MADKSIFNDVKTTLKGTSKMDGTCVVLRIGDNADSLVMQTARISATRAPQTFWEIGSNNFYIVDARPSGNADFVNIIGPTKNSLDAMLTLADVCKDHNVTLSFKGNSCGKNSNQASGTITLVGSILTAVSLTASASQVTIAGQWGVTFADILKS